MLRLCRSGPCNLRGSPDEPASASCAQEIRNERRKYERRNGGSRVYSSKEANAMTGKITSKQVKGSNIPD
jgi:hypothetical protein